ncbi:MAG TPA: heavy-metal-associated domain-containing protein [Phycisphaerae bacterium]|jgi:copper chaperone
MKTVEIKIDGMSCGGCVNSVTMALSKVPGVTTQKVEIGRARVQVNEPDGNAEAAVAAIEKAGFDAQVERT